MCGFGAEITMDNVVLRYDFDLKWEPGIFKIVSLLGVDSAQGAISTPKKLYFSENMTQIRLGAEHGLAVSESGKVFTWGWNEHGNCGNGSTDNVYLLCYFWEKLTI